MISAADICKYDGNRALARAGEFIYLAPGSKLQDIILNYTITFPSEGTMSDEYTVVPHGCVTLVYALEKDDSLRGDLFGSMLKQAKVGEKEYPWG